MSEPISVTYTFVDGAHFFTADDPKWCGLCAASTDLKTAYEDVSIQLGILAEINHGQKNAKFKPVREFPEFLKDLIGALDTALDQAKKELAAKKAELAKMQAPKNLDLGSIPSTAHMVWQPVAFAA